MTIPEACELVILTVTLAEQGELYLLDMGNPIRIVDIAKRMVQARGLRVGRDIPISYIGLRPGERLHETLVGANEHLSSTVYEKIFCVTNTSISPSLETIAQHVQTLSDSLQEDDYVLIRKYLFEIVQLKDEVLAR